jgi:spore coat protein CotF
VTASRRGGRRGSVDHQQNRLTDQDIANDLLCGLKELALGYHMASTEAANQGVWNTFVNSHDEIMKQQRELWETMYSKGWYQVKGAHDVQIQHQGFGGGVSPTQRM